MTFRILIDIGAVVGFITATWFLCIFRPRAYLQASSLNAVSFIFIIWLLFTSTLYLSVVGGSFTEPKSADPEQIVYLVARVIADAALIYRLWSFYRYRAGYAAQIAAERRDEVSGHQRPPSPGQPATGA